MMWLGFAAHLDKQIGDGGDLAEALECFAAVRPDDQDWEQACAAPGAEPMVRRYASFDAFLDNADELETLPVTAAMIREALGDTPPDGHLL